MAYEKYESEQKEETKRWNEISIRLNELKSRHTFLSKNIEKLAEIKSLTYSLTKEDHRETRNKFIESTTDTEAKTIFSEIQALSKELEIYSEAIETLAQTLGMFRAVYKGFTQFKQSVEKVKYEETTYSSLKRLSIIVPDIAIEYNNRFNDFYKQIKNGLNSLDPELIAKVNKSFKETYLQEQTISHLFNSMGNSLEKACEVWG